MDREIVIAVLDDIVRTVILLCDSNSERKVNLKNVEVVGKSETQICQAINNEEGKRLLLDSDINLEVAKEEDPKEETKLDVEVPLERTSDYPDQSINSREVDSEETFDSQGANRSNQNSVTETNEFSNDPTESLLTQDDNRTCDQNLETSEYNTNLDNSNLNNPKENSKIKKSNSNLIPKGNFKDSVTSTEQKFPITDLKRSPRIYGRKVRQIEDLAIPSTSTGIVPSVIVINDFSNASTSSAYSTSEMQRRTVENNFAFLSDSDLSDDENLRCEENFACENRAFESFDESFNQTFEAIEIADETEIIPVENYETIKYNNYIWSSMGLMKFAQVICCITMYVSIGLCRFHSKYIQIFSIFGACFSIFLLIVYSYRIQIEHWKAYTIRLLLSEYVYLAIYTTCDTVFAIIKFEFNEEANYRERMAVIILMISTGVAASTYCYDAILCYSLIEEASRNNPDEKKLLLSYLPTCSQSSRAEICDIFHTCIL